MVNLWPSKAVRFKALQTRADRPRISDRQDTETFEVQGQVRAESSAFDEAMKCNARYRITALLISRHDGHGIIARCWMMFPASTLRRLHGE
jgi:hypothetical protein